MTTALLWLLRRARVLVSGGARSNHTVLSYLRAYGLTEAQQVDSIEILHREAVITLGQKIELLDTVVRGRA